MTNSTAIDQKTHTSTHNATFSLFCLRVPCNDTIHSDMIAYTAVAQFDYQQQQRNHLHAQCAYEMQKEKGRLQIIHEWLFIA